MFSQRSSDELMERICAGYIDKYLFGKLQGHSVRRNSDAETQILGEDLEWVTPSGKRLVIDEKAKTQGLINKVLMYPSFEILCRNRNGDYFDSWFINARNISTHYSMISIATHDGDYPKDSEDISAMVYGLVSKDALYKYLSSIGLSHSDLLQDAWSISGIETVKVYQRDINGKSVYLKCSASRDEQPVNLIVRRDILRKEGIIKEIFTTRTGYGKYQYPRDFRYEEIF